MSELTIIPLDLDLPLPQPFRPHSARVTPSSAARDPWISLTFLQSMHLSHFIDPRTTGPALRGAPPAPDSPCLGAIALNWFKDGASDAAREGRPLRFWVSDRTDFQVLMGWEWLFRKGMIECQGEVVRDGKWLRWLKEGGERPRGC